MDVMPCWARLTIAGLGLMFFLGHLGWTIYAVHFHAARDKRLEAAGFIVPGCAGLLIAAVFLIPHIHGWVMAMLLVLALALIFVGRAIYELVVFRHDDPLSATFRTNDCTALDFPYPVM